MDLGETLEFIQHQRLIQDYTYVAAVALLLYDYILTLHLEVKLVWMSRWSYTKALFLLVRYIPLFNIWILLYIQLFPDPRQGVCARLYAVGSSFGAAGVVFAECVLMLRTWAVWRRSRNVGILLVLLFLVLVGLELLSCVKFIKSVHVGKPLYHGYRGCFLIHASPVWDYAFGALVAIDFIVLILMVISAFAAWRDGRTQDLSNIVHRDAILFYVYLLCLTIASTLVMNLMPRTLVSLALSVQIAVYSVLTTRMILNIREVAQRAGDSTCTELHYSTHTEHTRMSHLRFRVSPS